MKNSEKIALGISGIICFVSALFRPIVWFLEKSTNGVLRLLGIDPHEADETVSEEDIRLMVDEGSRSGAIDEDEQEIIHNLFEFDDKTVGEFSTHRTELAVLWLEDGVEEWENIIYDSFHSSYLVCEETIDNVKGELITKRFLRLHSQGKDVIVKEAIEPSLFIPETMKADVAFKFMKQKSKNTAVVLDEYGGVTGLVTMKDIISQIVGDFDTEEDETAVPDIQCVGEGEYIIQGTTPLDDVASVLSIELPTEEYDTFGGYVFGLIGNIPDNGEEIECCDTNISIKSNDIESHRLISAKVTLLTKTGEDEEKEEKEN